MFKAALFCQFFCGYYNQKIIKTALLYIVSQKKNNPFCFLHNT